MGASAGVPCMVGAESIVGMEAEETLTSAWLVGCMGGSDASGAGASWTGMDSVSAGTFSLAAVGLVCFAGGLRKASMRERERKEGVTTKEGRKKSRPYFYTY